MYFWLTNIKVKQFVHLVYYDSLVVDIYIFMTSCDLDTHLHVSYGVRCGWSKFSSPVHQPALKNCIGGQVDRQSVYFGGSTGSSDCVLFPCL